MIKEAQNNPRYVYGNCIHLEFCYSIMPIVDCINCKDYLAHKENDREEKRTSYNSDNHDFISE